MNEKEEKEKREDSCRLIQFAEWVLVSIGRIRMQDFMKALLPRSRFLEQQGLGMNFEIPKDALEAVASSG